MTEQNSLNREIYLELCKNVWSFDDASMKYVEYRTSDNWRPETDFNELIKNFEDQRIRFDMDMSNPSILSFFESGDNSYKMFKTIFKNILALLNIEYKDFIQNKIVYNKNTMKIKKVFEILYASNQILFEKDSGLEYSKENCSSWIIKSFEKIGASKKSVKKLQLVISFNPIDWLLASTAEKKFSSCISIDNEKNGGFEYCLGLPFLCGDRNRMMLYITDGKQKEYRGIKVDSVQTRTWCFLDNKNKFAIAKWYPNDTIGIEPIKQITGSKNFISKSYFKEGKYPIDILSTKKGVMVGIYSDMGKLEIRNDKIVHVGNTKLGQQVFTKNLIDVTRADTYDLKNINCFPKANRYQISTWIDNKYQLDDLFQTYQCDYCGKTKTGFNIKNQVICYDCYKEKAYTCPLSFNFVLGKDVSKEVETSYGKVMICDSCYKDANVCSYCNKYSLSIIKTDDNKTICIDCYKKSDYQKCDVCEIISKEVKTYHNTFDNTSTSRCNKCFKNIKTSHLTFGKYNAIINGKRGKQIE